MKGVIQLYMEQKKYPVVCIIPSLNPDELFLETVNKLIQVGFTDIIVVDDGSKPECKYYFTEAQKLGVIILTHEINKGKGAALKTAFNYYLNHFDITYYKGIVTADADGQHLATDIRETADRLINSNKNDMCMVLGTRDFSDKIVPFKSRNGNKITTVVFKLLFGKYINDTQTGLRGISNAFLEKCIHLKQNRFEYEINMLIEAVRNRIEIVEVPISTVYFDGNRETHFRPFADSFKIYSVMFRSFICYAGSGLISWIIDQTLFYLLVNFAFKLTNHEMEIIFSTMIARLVSSLVNYSINRNYVFGKKDTEKTLLKYYVLCISQMIISAGGVAALYYFSNINSSILKIIVDTIIFFVNYRIQQAWVFKTKRE